MTTFVQTCRYSIGGYDCYCCGAFLHYIEQVVKLSLLSQGLLPSI